MNFECSVPALAFLAGMAEARLTGSEWLNVTLLPSDPNLGIQYNYLAIGKTKADPRKIALVLDNGLISVTLCIQAVDDWKRTSTRFDLVDHRLWCYVTNGSLNIGGKMHSVHSDTHVRMLFGSKRFEP